MNKVKKLIVDTLQSVLRRYGFEKDGSVWFRETDGVLSMIELMQSQYGFQKFSLLIGLHVRSLATSNLKLSKKGVPQAAIGSWDLIGNLESAELRRALNGEVDVPDDVRRDAVIEALEQQAMPMFNDFASSEGISKYLADGVGMFVSGSLRDWVRASVNRGASHI